MKIAIIGDGGWGTALAVHLARKKLKVNLWGAFPDYVKKMERTRNNSKFLPGIVIPMSIKISNDLAVVLKDAKLIVLAVPSQYMRDVVKKINKFNTKNSIFLSVAKGLEYKSNKIMTEVIKEELKGSQVAVLSGPNIAYEVAQGVPSAAVCASVKKHTAVIVQDILTENSFRVYTSSDVKGVELAGAFKNIIAIACGISDGLGFGTNTKSALLTRGLAEITQLGSAMGAKHKTFSGLSGMGDIVTTCMSSRSRNRSLGEQLGQGRTLEGILKKTEMVVEGITTTKIALKLARRYEVNMPITQEVYNVLYKHKKPKAAMESLMQRRKKSEF
ncbi:MAG: NAD(P)-dependent glycerol-3-phosphate dehydrogenase [Candidatus Omnitrophica bacterium]|nr:NAD(P)-dependent glycerol-3-phosphate dehydrogenase [Candidatus Omnitrophota bacterium]